MIDDDSSDIECNDDVACDVACAGFTTLYVIGVMGVVIGGSISIVSLMDFLWDKDNSVLPFLYVSLGITGIGVLACCGLFARFKYNGGYEESNDDEEKDDKENVFQNVPL